MFIKNDFSLESKIKRIKRTKKIEEVSLECLPPVQTDEYYFVSYSHKDYKKVYSDIFYFQLSGVSIWYDRGMSVGKNWKDTAEQYINKYNCKGVILYVSENSIQSKSIFQEIMFAKECGKDILMINIDYKGVFYSAEELINLLSSKGLEFSNDEILFVKKYLNTDVLYLKYCEEIDKKIEKIHLLKEPNLLNLSLSDDKEVLCYYDIDESELENFLFCKTVLISDSNVNKVEIKDFKKALDVLLEEQPNNTLKRAYIYSIQQLTFSNCTKLEMVELPKTVYTIGSYSFYNCYRLKNIDISKIGYISSNAFENCFSLESINISGLSTVSKGTFYNCRKLKEVIFPNELIDFYEYAFAKTAIESVNLNYVGKISLRAFEECKYLKEFVVSSHSEFNIEESAFRGCESLEKFVSKGICHSIGDRAFADCASLESVTFDKGEIKIGMGAFDGCVSLIEFPLENAVSIGFEAFRECRKLKVSKLACESVGMFAFKNCLNILHLEFNTTKTLVFTKMSLSCIPNLEKVVFNCTIFDLPSGTFALCSSLKEITIPNSITKICNDTFYRCFNLKKIIYDGTISQWKELMKNNSVDIFVDTGDYIIVCIDGILHKN